MNAKPTTVIFRTLDGLEAVGEVRDGKFGIPRRVMRPMAFRNESMSPSAKPTLVIDYPVRKYAFFNEIKNGLPVLTEVTDW